MLTRRGWRRVVVAAVAVLALPTAALFGRHGWTNNLATLEPGRVYRAGQMSGPTVARTVRGLKVKTVLNLRGPNPKSAWYRDERAATTGAGARQVDVALASDQWLSRAQLRAVVRVLDTCEYPLLIHCQWGAERTGLVSAVSELLRPGGTLETARAQFSIRYLYLPVGDGTVMAAHLERYAAWLRDRGVSHTPDRFRAWADGGYVPGKPSREDWPYDPHPLVVETPPGPGTVAGAEPTADGLRR